VRIAELALLARDIKLSQRYARMRQPLPQAGQMAFDQLPGAVVVDQESPGNLLLRSRQVNLNRAKFRRLQPYVKGGAPLGLNDIGMNEDLVRDLVR
jgi:hypothetical protein